MTPEELAEKIESEESLTIDIQAFLPYIRVAKADGHSDEKIKRILLKIDEIMEAYEDQGIDTDQIDLNPEDIVVDDLPDELDRDDWR